jgi:hypothetical protein
MAWYVVHHGREPSVYSSWDKAHALVDGFKGNCYKKYNSREEAFEAFFGHGQPVNPPLLEPMNPPLLELLHPPLLEPAGHDQFPLWHNSFVVKVVLIVVMALVIAFLVWKLM